jgi:hypothetical protein
LVLPEAAGLRGGQGPKSALKLSEINMAINDLGMAFATLGTNATHGMNGTLSFVLIAFSHTWCIVLFSLSSTRLAGPCCLYGSSSK